MGRQKCMSSQLFWKNQVQLKTVKYTAPCPSILFQFTQPVST